MNSLLATASLVAGLVICLLGVGKFMAGSYLMAAIFVAAGIASGIAGANWSSPKR